MKNVARTKFRNDYKTATFPGDVRLSYVDTLTKVGDDELVEAIDLTFVPGHDERVALAHGGFVQVVMPGVTSPPQIALNVIDSTIVRCTCIPA